MLFSLAGAIALAAALRGFGLGRALWLDEAVTWAVSRLPLTTIAEVPGRDAHPPLYYCLQHFALALLPESEAGLRALSFLASLATVTGAVLLLRRHWGHAEALTAGILIALSSFDIYYAQEARMYALLAILWLANLWLLNEALALRPRALVGWSATCVLLSYTHYYGLSASLFSIVVLLLWSATRTSLGRRSRLLLGAVGTLTLGATLASLYWLLGGGPYSGAAGAWPPRPFDLLHLGGLVTSGLIAARSRFLDAAHLAPWQLERVPEAAWCILGMVLFAVPVTVGLRRALGRNEHWRRLACLSLAFWLWAVLPPLLYGWLFGRDVWAFKALLGAGTLLLVWAGVGLPACRVGLRATVLAFYGLTSALSLVPYYGRWEKSPLAPALRELAAMSSPPPTVLLDRPVRAPLAFYYLGSTAQLLALGQQATGAALARIRPDEHWGFLGRAESLDCDDARLLAAEKIHVLIQAEEARRQVRFWPACLRRQSLRVFRGGGWRALPAPRAGRDPS